MAANKLAGLIVLGALASGALALGQGSGALAQSNTPAALDAPSVAPLAVPLATQVQDALQNCYQCHGPDGVSIIPSRPTIAGQNAEYLQRQLRAFKRAAGEDTVDADRDGDDPSGAAPLAPRTDPVMEHMVSGLPDHLVAPIAEAISKLPCDGAKPNPPPAKPLVRPQAVAACVSCHGDDGIGTQPVIPNIAGQQRSYLRRQLLLIRETAWGAQPREGEAWRSHPIMETKAARLKIADIDAIAHYYAQLDCRGDGATGGSRAK